MASSGIWQGAERATRNMATTGMGLAQLQQQRQHQAALEADSARRLQIAEDSAKIQNATAQIQLDEARKVQEMANRPIDITVNPAFLSLPDESKGDVLKFFTQNGLTNEQGVGTAGGVNRGLAMIDSSANLFQRFLMPVVESKKKETLSAWDEYQNALATGNQNKIRIAKIKHDKAFAEYGMSLGKYNEHLKTLAQKEEANAKRELSRAILGARLNQGSRTNDRATLKDMATAEGKILENVHDKGMAGRVKQYNALSKDDMYVWGDIPGRFYGKNEGWVKQPKSERTVAQKPAIPTGDDWFDKFYDD